MEYRFEVVLSENPKNPRDWGNFGKMICFHGRYDLGDKHDYSHLDYSGWDEMKKAIIKNEKVRTILPLYLYDHSGLSISTSPFSCPWHSGQVGFIYCTKKDVKENFMGMLHKDRIVVLLKGEVERYDKYLKGEEYGYVIYEITDNGEKVINSCYGYEDKDYCEQEAKRCINYYETTE